MQRKIIHIDCDCFYAAIEERDNPALRGRPVAVGGSSKRGVVATCNYPARKYGIHSAMASVVALRRCAELQLIRPRMDVYKTVSKQIHAIFLKYTDKIEPLSLDEAYLDVSNSKIHNNSATRIAKAIRKDIEDNIGITASAGIAPNKFLAKVASDWNKPNGQFVVLPNDIDCFIKQLPVNKIHGVGKVTNKKMLHMKIKTCGDLQSYSQLELCEKFGTFGLRLYDYARGIDLREVKTERRRKSISVELTYTQDLLDLQSCLQQLPGLIHKLDHRCEQYNKELAIKTVFVKIKFNNFQTTTVEESNNTISLKIVEALLAKGYARKKMPVRLIGIGVKLAIQTSNKNTAATDSKQLHLF